MIVGVLGGGQLARLLALAGHRLGVKVICLDPAADACAGAVAEHRCATFDDPAALAELAARCQVVTCEFENLPPQSLRFLEQRVPMYPGTEALRVAADRLEEKTLFRRLGMATADFAPVTSLKELQSAAARIGLPALLKTRRAGYDGKGQQLLRDPADVGPAWQALGGVPAILEDFVPFDREISIVAARGRTGDMVFYPISQNTHRDGILRLSVSRPGDPAQERAEALARRLMTELGYVGVLALELFQAGDALLANEFAPRVHNSGHWTPEGAETNQFENHLRAVLGLPLGATAAVGTAAMVNFIGRMPDSAEVLAVPHAHLESYGKSPRPLRKLGHATVRAHDAGSCEQLAARLLALAERA